MSEVSEDLREQRLAKLQRLRELGLDPYPARVVRSHTVAKAMDAFDALSEGQDEVSLVGRVVSVRAMGKATFAHMMDGTGRIQIYVKQDKVGPDAYAVLKLADVGDFVSVRGILFRTRTGEPTVEARDFSIISKSLLPLPPHASLRST